MNTTLTRAVEAARAGRYEDAFVRLEELGGQGSEDTRVLDLLARVHAQQGKFADADLCWARAQEIEPGLQAAVEGRRRIAALQARRFRPRVLPVVVVAIVAGVGVLLPISPPPGPLPEPPDLSGLDTLAGRQDQLARELAALQASVAGPQQRLDQLAGALDSPRFTVARQGGAVLVTFNEALFSRDVRLSTSGRESLAELGRVVESLPAQVSVIGHGTTVQLGFRRAQVAAAELGIPLGAVNLRSSTQSPYPAGDRRNNTVTVLIDPAGPR